MIFDVFKLKPSLYKTFILNELQINLGTSKLEQLIRRTTNYGYVPFVKLVLRRETNIYLNMITHVARELPIP